MKFIKQIRFLVPASVALLAFIVYFIPLQDDYRINLFTELIGVLVTVVLVDYLYRIESKKEERKQEEIKLLNIDSVLSIYMRKYTESLNIMTSEKLDPKRNLSTIKINDLQYIFNKAGVSMKPFFLTKHQLYFDSLDKLIAIIQQVLPGIDARHHPLIINWLQTFTTYNDIQYLREMVEERTQINYGQELASMKDQEMLKNLEVDTTKKNKRYSTHSVYSQLIESINLNLSIISAYEAHITKIKYKYNIKSEEG